MFSLLPETLFPFLCTHLFQNHASVVLPGLFLLRVGYKEGNSLPDLKETKIFLESQCEEALNKIVKQTWDSLIDPHESTIQSQKPALECAT